MPTTPTSKPNHLALISLVCFATAAVSVPSLAAEPVSLDDLAWISGHWRTEGDNYLEELWTEPAGGLMLGLNRELVSGQRAWFEYLRIESGPDGLVYVASPAGEPPTRFPLARAEGRQVVFENPEHDWPQVIEYRLDDDGVLRVRVAGLEAGSRELQLVLHRVE